MAAQLPDILILHDQKMDLYSNPLESYWEITGKKRPDFFELDVCKRGYVATWVIRNNELLLAELDGDIRRQHFFFGNKQVKASVTMLFPQANNLAVLASWFSGKLRIPTGNMTSYSHRDYYSRFEKEIIATVEKGKVIKSVLLDYTHQRLVVNEGGIQLTRS